jgi:hypothetical protein
MSVYNKSECRLCESKDMAIALPLSPSPLCDAYVKEKKDQVTYDLNLLLCNNCQFSQIDTVVSPEVIYRDYLYVTTSSSGLNKHFEGYASEVCNFLSMHASRLTIDIGSNDGSLLKYFKKEGHTVLGVEPATEIALIACESGIETLPEFFDSRLAQKIEKEYGKADLITVNNLFANIDDLSVFVSGVVSLLSNDGVLVIESSYLHDMVDNMVFDFIYHEHLSYFSIQPLVRFFEKFDMKLIRIQKVSTKGGSLRYYWASNDSKWDQDQSVSFMLEEEIKRKLCTDSFKKFEQKINEQKARLHDFLDSYSGKKIVGYGASATSTTLISHFGLHDYFNYLVDDNPAKINTFSPGYHIPVYDSSMLEENIPDVIVILAWRYSEQILPKIKSIGSAVVIPLPYFKECGVICGE